MRKFLFASMLFGLSIGQAQANITFTFTESGGNVLMQSSGVLDTGNLVSRATNGATWNGAGVQNGSGLVPFDAMGDGTLGGFDSAYVFNTGTDTSAWFGNMFTSDNFSWSTTGGTTQFATYAYDGTNFNPGIMISSADKIGNFWTPNVSWSTAGTFASLGLTAGTYRITDSFGAESITIQIGTPATVAAVPEPETYAMFLGGLGLMGFAARRKKAA
jgi:hypothetical protein